MKVCERGTIRAVSEGLNIGVSTALRAIEQGLIKKVVTHVKPSLTVEQKRTRLEFCMKHIDLPNCQFHSFNDVIHIDEKWFYIQKINQKMYLLKDEPIPIRKTQSKRFMQKVMFLCAVGKPRPNHKTGAYFNGNLGCFPIIEDTPAKRNSKNRPKSTMVMKEITSVTSEVMKK